jgi:hypothetical protein
MLAARASSPLAVTRASDARVVVRARSTATATSASAFASTRSRARINGYGGIVARTRAVTKTRASDEARARAWGRTREVGVAGERASGANADAGARNRAARRATARDARAGGAAGGNLGNIVAGDERAWWRDVRANASANASGSEDSGSEDEGADAPQKNTLVSLLSGFVSRLVKPLQDFGFGRTRLWEGGVGLFMITGVALSFVIWGWIQGLLSFARKNSYQAFIEFPVACGIQVGTNVRIRGVKAGSVLSVQPSLEKVEVLVEMDDKNVPIPRNSLIEANQSGLIAETIIDITPAIPIPVAQWGPLDSGCEGEGVIVCDRGKIKGLPGVSMDELVGICTKLAREMERQDGMNKMFDTTDTARRLMTTLQPLLREAAQIAQELRPMMQGVNEQGTLDTLESLAGQTSATVEDIRKLKDAILTEENQELLRQSISTLTKTLQHVEKVSGDISSVSGDPSTRANLRHLIQSLSRLVDA